MGSRSGTSRQIKIKNGRSERSIRQLESQYPGRWILLEVTEQVNDEPTRGRVIATARDPEVFQRKWRKHRQRGILTMLTFGPPLKAGPAMVASAA